MGRNARTTMFRKPLLLLVSILLLTSAFAQLSWRPGEVLLLLKKDATQKDVLREITNALPAGASLSKARTLGKKTRYVHCAFAVSSMSDADLEKLVARVPGVEATSLNYKLEHLIEPNDTQYDGQWNIEDSGVESVWDHTTGGTMANGVRIGVGISDLAIQTSHPDLQGNIWEGSPAMGAGADHGTEVASVLGAVGNNGIGIAGVNWDVEIVSSGQTDDLSDAIEQFEFALELREEFNASNGLDGLLVVSITASWGSPGSSPCNGFAFPLFSDMADAGIILVASGPNDDVSIEDGSDFPANCALAEHLVVTSYGPNNETPFAFGPNTVHLLAPGLQIHVATVTSTYTVSQGNSFAIPMVAGAVALLYSIPCPSFAALVMNDPQAARTMVKNAILNNTTPFPGGSALTITGGKLNVQAAYDALMAQCVPTCREITVTFSSSGNAPAVSSIIDWTATSVATGSSGTLSTCIDDGCYTAIFTDINGDPIAGTYEVTDADENILADGASPDGTVAFSHGNIVAGCTTPTAGNFNPFANCDDGSCGGSSCIPIQFQIASADFLSEGIAEVLIISNGAVVFDGPVDISFDPDNGASLAAVELCADPGCLSFTIESSTVAIYPDGAFIIDGNDNEATFFSTAQPFHTAIGGSSNEICDGADNDCDGLIDEDFIWYADNDGDGFGVTGTGAVFCTEPIGMVQADGDCDDTNDALFPGAADECMNADGLDNDCDGDTDEDGLTTWFLDQDLDGFGVGETTLVACEQPAGYASVEGDCDDNNDTVFPDAPELCDGLDNDCDGDSDEDFIWYADADGDGFGDDATQQVSCAPLPDGVRIGGDCNDADEDITTVGSACDDGNADTNNDVVRSNCLCLGFEPGECPPGEITDCNGNCAPIEWIGDGICDDGSAEWSGVPIFFNCAEFNHDNGDCDPNCVAEVCDGLDNDCDGDVDEDFTWFTDADGDEYGAIGSAVILCDGPTEPGMVQQGGDCDDTDQLVNPAQNEACGDGIDNNCDGFTDGTTANFQSGCTNPLACNYDPNALCDDGSCDLDTQPAGNEAYAEDWTLTDTEGNTIELYALLEQGHTVVLDLFTTWCPPSQAMLTNGYLEAWNQHLGPNGLDHIRMISIEMEDTATSSLQPFNALSSWPVIARGGNAIKEHFTNIGLGVQGFPTIYMICPDRSVRKLYGLGVDELPGDIFQYDQQDAIALLNEACGCHSAPCTGLAGCTDPAACNYDPDATCSDGSCLASPIWYFDQDGDGFGSAYSAEIACAQPSGYVMTNGDCNVQDPNSYPGATELCDGLDNNCNGTIDEGLAPIIDCPGDLTFPATEADCSAFPSFQYPELTCGTGAMVQLAGPSSGSSLPLGNTSVTFGAFHYPPITTLFSEDFSDNSAGWIVGPEWQIGAAAASTTCVCDQQPSDDPAEDHSPTTDNGIAGMTIGACVDTEPHFLYYLTSPTVDVSALQGPLVLEFWRHLHADYSPYMEHVIEAFDGISWVVVWSNQNEACINDAVWNLQQVDVTDHKNAEFRVRFGQAVGDPEAFSTGGWSIDDVRFLGDAAPASTCSFDMIVELATWYADADEDGFGDANTSVTQCEAPNGYVTDNTDCNDANANIAPDANEVCDGSDNDCDGEVDEGFPQEYADGDGDGFGDPLQPLPCDTPGVANNLDCNDNDPGVNPDEGCSSCSLADRIWITQNQSTIEELVGTNLNACIGSANLVACLTDLIVQETPLPEACATCIAQRYACILSTCLVPCLGGFETPGCQSCVQSSCNAAYFACAGFTDVDGDGVVAEEDCNDNNAAIYPGAAEICDGLDNDCDGSTDEGVVVTWYTDADFDGYGDDTTALTGDCDQPPGMVTNGGDCDDTDQAIFPGAPELCDNIDNDCDGAVDNNAGTAYYTDADNDTFGDDASETFSCTPIPGMITQGGDCDDSNSDVHPGASDPCDDLDQNCDGGPYITTWYQDSDGDTYGNDAVFTQDCTQPPGFVTTNGDCDDTNANVFAGQGCGNCSNTDQQWLATHQQDLINAMGACAGQCFDDANCLVVCMQEQGIPLSALCLSCVPGYVSCLFDNCTFACLNSPEECLACQVQSGCVAQLSTCMGMTDADGDGWWTGSDCNDGNVTIYPGAPEICDGLDNDCDGSIDEGLTFTYYTDTDGDGFGQDGTGVQGDCDQPPGTALQDGDCDDTNNTVFPGAGELCDNIDNDCDGEVDDEAGELYYTDADGDGYGDETSAVLSCTPVPNTILQGGDCNDGDASINPGAADPCDSIDQDCSGGPVLTTWYQDLDADDFGNADVTLFDCTQPSGYVAQFGDCDDTDADLFPGNGCGNCLPTEQLWSTTNQEELLSAMGTCMAQCLGDPQCISSCMQTEGIPLGAVCLTCVEEHVECIFQECLVQCLDSPEACNECQVQAGCIGALATCMGQTDADGDGWWAGSDCDDANALINPWALEICDGVDNDCDGATDENAGEAYYPDADGDGYGDDNAMVLSCTAIPGMLTTGGDCDDTDPLVNPLGTEVCNDRDDNCDGQIDEGLQTFWYVDLDGDGYGDPSTEIFVCDAPSGYVQQAGDCHDGLASVYPGAPELCDGIDNDCDGSPESLTDSDGDTILDCEDGCPFLSGDVGSPCPLSADPLVPLGIINETCTCTVACTQNIVVDLRTDINSQEASFIIRDEITSQVRCQGSGYFPGITSPIVVDCCLPEGCFKLEVYDSGGDGFVTGGYQVREVGATGRRIIDNFGNFTTGGYSGIGAPHSFCLPMGNDKLTYGTCDKLTWVNSQYVVAHENSTVSAEWIPSGPNNVQDGNSGYEFWIFDPNGTYSFRRFRAHNTGDGYSPANERRACHMQLNGWTNTASTPHVPVNVLMNVRIRGRVNGVNLGEFGPACRLKIDPVAAACPPIWLQDDPSNTTDFSCGVMRNWGGSNSSANKLVARPPQFVPNSIPGPVRYQFRFRISGEGICITRPPQSSPTLYLNWNNGAPLQCSRTYEVDVRASKDGGVTWCTDVPSPACYPATVQSWGRFCTVTINPCATGGGVVQMDEQPRNGRLLLFPNPNNGQRIHVATDVPFTGDPIEITFHAMNGTLIRKLPVSTAPGSTSFNLELNDALASGIYIVTLTSNDRTFTERLVIQD